MSQPILLSSGSTLSEDLGTTSSFGAGGTIAQREFDGQDQTRTQELIGDYNNIITDMKKQITSMKSRIKHDASSQQCMNVTSSRHEGTNSIEIYDVEEGEEQPQFYDEQSEEDDEEEVYECLSSEPLSPKSRYEGQPLSQRNPPLQQNLQSTRQSNPLKLSDFNTRRVFSQVNLNQETKPSFSLLSSPQVQYMSTQDKENMGSVLNTPPYDKQYRDQLTLNQQLIAKVNQLQNELNYHQSDIRLVKMQENEEFYREKIEELENDNYQLKQENGVLFQQVDDQIQKAHSLEEKVENWEIDNYKSSDKFKDQNKKIQEFNSKIQELSHRNSILENKNKQLSDDKQKLSEKWIRLSARQKVDEKSKNKQKSLENDLDKQRQQSILLRKKCDDMEAEIEIMRDKQHKADKKIKEQAKTIKEFDHHRKDLSKEMELADQVTKELLDRVQSYENEIQHYKDEIDNLHYQVQNTKQLHQEFTDINEKVIHLQRESEENGEYIQRLENDNQTLDQENRKYHDQLQVKEQEFQQLLFQLEQQRNEFSQAHQELESIMKRKKISKVGDNQVQQAIDFVERECPENQSVRHSQWINPTDLDDDSLLIRSSLVRAVERLQYLQKYAECTQKESEEANEKYERLLIKYREMANQTYSTHSTLESHREARDQRTSYASQSAAQLNTIREQPIRASYSQAQLLRPVESYDHGKVCLPNCIALQQPSISQRYNSASSNLKQPVAAYQSHQNSSLHDQLYTQLQHKPQSKAMSILRQSYEGRDLYQVGPESARNSTRNGKRANSYRK